MSDDNLNEKNMIDVIDEFDYSTQNDAYNEKFRAWRSRKNNPYAFSFEKNQRESVYIEGRGFIENSLEAVEKKVLTRIFFTLGIAALMWIFFDDLFSKLIISLLSYAGLDIHINFSSSIIYGGCHDVAGVLIVLGLIKLAIPQIYLHFKFKVPHKAEFMSSMNNPSALIGAMSMAFLVCVAMSIPTAYSTETKEAVAFFASSGADVSIWSQSEFIIYTIFDVLVIPIASQLLFCGAAFAVLRQFGDPFAMLITSLTSALLTQDFRLMPTVFFITFVGCYGMLASGTIFTAIAVNIIYKMYDMTLTLIETNTSDNMPQMRNIFMAVLLVIGAVGLAYYRITLRKRKLRLAAYSSELTFGGRIMHSAMTFPYSAVAILCIIYAFMKAVL